MALEVIAGYKLLEEIKRGKYSISYKAHNSKGDKCFIKKHFLKKVTEDVITNIDQWKDLSPNPYIVHLIDYIYLQRDKQLYVVCEYMTDDNLYDYIINHNPDRSTILLFMSDIARAVAYLHNLNIVHQNLHLQNIFVFSPGQRSRCKIGEGFVVSDKASNLYDPPEMEELSSVRAESNIYSMGLIYVAVYRGVLEINEEKMLFPYVQIGNKWRSITWSQKRSKDVSRHLPEICGDNPTLLKLLTDMLEYEPENRPNIQIVIESFQKIVPDTQEMDDVDSAGVESFVQIKKSRSVEIDESSIEPAIYAGSGKDSEQEHFSSRLRTFPQSWPHGTDESLQLAPEHMANAGFYFVGEPDIVRCYSCKSELKNWENNDDPWEEHKKIKADCVLVKQHEENLQDTPQQPTDHEESIAEPKFKVIDKLGKGGFGEVEQVQLLETGGFIARKVVELEHIPVKRETAINEFKIARNLREHQNIIKMIDSFLSEKMLVLHLELSEIGNLNDYIVRNQPKFKNIEGFLVDLANGVNHLHTSTCSIIHRDLKPANILIFNNYRGLLVCKLADFGISKYNYQPGMMITNFGQPCIHWSAPEIDGFNHKYTPAVDIYSVGAIFVALAVQHVTQEGDLLPIWVHMKKKCSLHRIVLHRDYEDIEKLTNFLLPVFCQDGRMASLVASMVQDEAEKRPKSMTVCGELEKICDTKKRPYVARNQFYNVPKENSPTDYVPVNNNYQCPQQ